MAEETEFTKDKREIKSLIYRFFVRYKLSSLSLVVDAIDVTDPETNKYDNEFGVRRITMDVQL